MALRLLALAFIVIAGGACGDRSSGAPAASTKSGGEGKGYAADPNVVTVDDQQLQRMKIEMVNVRSFTVEKSATGRIAFNEDVSTPVFSPYTGRVTRLIAKPGEDVRRGSSLFELDTLDVVQAQSDLIAARSAAIKAKNQLELAQRNAARQKDLFEAKAVSQKDYEQAQNDLRNAESDLHSAEGVLRGTRDRIRLLGKTDEEITRIEEERRIDRVTRVLSPIAGTVTTRKVGPGQYVRPDSPDPLFTISDLSTMWLFANVYETDIPLIRVGQQVEVQVMAYPNEVFRARIAYIGASADPATHRIGVRAEVANRDRKLKPEMFASFRITTNEQVQAPAVPVGAIVQENNVPMVWVVTGPNQVTRRTVQLGLEQDRVRQVLAGVQAGEKVITEGGIFLSNAEATKKPERAAGR